MKIIPLTSKISFNRRLFAPPCFKKVLTGGNPKVVWINQYSPDSLLSIRLFSLAHYDILWGIAKKTVQGRDKSSDR